MQVLYLGAVLASRLPAVSDADALVVLVVFDAEALLKTGRLMPVESLPCRASIKVTHAL